MRPALRVVVCPHPDDEGMVLSRLLRPAVFTVVVSLTRGEATRRIAGRDAALSAGRTWLPQIADQLRPEVQGSTATARILTWHRFLDALSSLCAWDRSTEMSYSSRDGVLCWAGERSLRMVFDCPDGGLTARAARAAVRFAVQAAPGSPHRRTTEIVLAAYHQAATSAGPPGFVHDHRDHRVLASIADDAAEQGRLWLRCSISQARARESGARDHPPGGEVVVELVSDAEYAFVMGDGDLHVGAFQEAYGWLAADGERWPRGDRDDGPRGVLFSRAARYLVRSASGADA